MQAAAVRVITISDGCTNGSSEQVLLQQPQQTQGIKPAATVGGIPATIPVSIAVIALNISGADPSN